MSSQIRLLVFGGNGRMGKNRHLINSLLILRAENFDLEITLVGRNFESTSALAKDLGCKVELDLQTSINSGNFDIYFDCAPPQGRAERIASAINAGINIYSEKPLAISISDIIRLVNLSETRGVITGVVADKKFTPGFIALQRLLDEQTMGNILNVNCDFGYWIASGLDGQKLQRPSWNYMKAKGGSLVNDIFPHWAYLLEMIAPVAEVFSYTSTHIKVRVDETGKQYEVDVPDTAQVILKLENLATVRISTSWLSRPAKPFTIEIDGKVASVRATPTTAKVTLDNGKSYDAIEKYEIKSQDEFYLQWKEYLECVRDKREPKFNFRASITSALLVESIERSAFKREPVLFSDLRYEYGISGLIAGSTK
jgi:predicted dehydrogenase